MPKKLDVLHYALIALLIGSLVYLGMDKSESETSNIPEDNYAFLMAKYKADSLFIAKEYDASLEEYEYVDSLFPRRVNFIAMQVLINQMKNNQPSNTEDSNQKLEKPNNLNQSTANSTKKETASSPVSDSISIVNFPKEKSTNLEQGALHFNNHDGAQIDYIGEIKNGKANGYGFAIFEKRGFYEGYWLNNKRNGEGVYSWQNGDSYEGDYVDGKRTGYGVYTFVTGDVYKGEWKNNLRHGEGILYNKKGKVVSSGPWVEDQPIMKKRVKKKK